MSFFGKFNFALGALVLAIALNGCLPADPGQLDEEKESHFVLGKSRVNSMDYLGAIESFQAALDANPRSSAAHFQLACLFDTKESDPAAAIYHYQEYVRLNPRADNAEVIRQRIYSCKQQLAADVLPLPSAPATMKQIEDLTEKNRKLQDEVDKWRAYYAAHPQTQQVEQPQQTSLTPDDVSAQTAQTQTATSTPTPAQTTTGNNSTTGSSAGRVNTTPTTRPTTQRTAKPRTHVVSSGETMAGIARKHGVTLKALLAANPSVNPKKLHTGQALNLPGS